MFTRKGLTLALATLCFTIIIVSGTLIQGMAGASPVAPPYAWKAVGPEISGPATLLPAKDNDKVLKATLAISSGTKKATLTYDFKTAKTANTLSDQEISIGATNYFLQTGSVAIKPPKTFTPNSGSGDLMILGITDLQVQRTNGLITKINCTAKLTFIAPQ
jgi:hypothetical protein